VINAIIGEVVEVNEQEVVLRTSIGLEFSLIISNQNVSRLSNLRKEEVRLLTSLQVREDSMLLYGFVDDEERQLFLELIKVSGIGPRQAMKILSGSQVRAFIKALDSNDVKFLSSIPGIGPKTAQKIVLALRGKIVLTEGDEIVGGGGGLLDPTYNDLVVALCDMGYDRRQVVTTLKQLLDTKKESLEGLGSREKEELLFKFMIIGLG
jgi:Holliday junction DNA helicase RuvA